MQMLGEQFSELDAVAHDDEIHLTAVALEKKIPHEAAHHVNFKLVLIRQRAERG